MISIIHPSRGRPEKALNTWESWFINRSYAETDWILSLDEDDNAAYNAYFDTTPIRIIRNKNRSAVDAINNAAKLAKYDILMIVSDDTGVGYSGWDSMILHEVEGKTDWILKTQDGIQPWIITQPILDRAYYNRFGYIYYPEYQHLFCDTELSCVADITGRKIKSNLLFPHKHYSVTKEQPDAINKKADATWAQGEKLFLERYKRNFDLPKGGKIEGQGMIDWLIKKGVNV